MKNQTKNSCMICGGPVKKNSRKTCSMSCSAKLRAQNKVNVMPNYRKTSGDTWTPTDEFWYVKHLGTGMHSKIALLTNRATWLRRYIEASHLRDQELFVVAGREYAQKLLAKEVLWV